MYTIRELNPFAHIALQVMWRRLKEQEVKPSMCKCFTCNIHQ